MGSAVITTDFFYTATFKTGASEESFFAIKKLSRGGDMLVIGDIVIDESK
jgi:hypothetical protein